MTTRRLIPSLGALIAALGVWAGAAVAAPPANTSAPTITGTPKVGETLTAQNGTWSNSPTAFQYQWQRCNASGGGCANIAGATEKAHLLTSADAGRTMRVRVTGINAEGAVNARSAQTAVVTPNAAPRNTARPTISGTPEAGEELTAEDGTWTNSPTAFTYQWQRCDIDAIACGPDYRRDREDLRRPQRRRRVSPPPRGDGEERQRFRLGPLGAVRHRRPVGSDHERAADGEADLGPLPRRPRLRPVPDLRRLAAEPDHPRHRVAKPGKAAYTRRFTTRVAPNPCGVYTRSWVPVPRLRGKGRYTVTIAVRDTSGRTSAPVRKTFSLR